MIAQEVPKVEFQTVEEIMGVPRTQRREGSVEVAKHVPWLQTHELVKGMTGIQVPIVDKVARAPQVQGA
eukprot:11163613-Lingulodinium_polyedra.AAC.1